ncbi:hypothetical protein EJ07DRAFT_154392 [Lizonia empirigonia]|nr:hypothetical protein EJ07DRAFT_154392 [Lizonia empirigonia]
MPIVLPTAALIVVAREATGEEAEEAVTAETAAMAAVAEGDEDHVKRGHTSCRSSMNRTAAKEKIIEMVETRKKEVMNVVECGRSDNSHSMSSTHACSFSSRA